MEKTCEQCRRITGGYCYKHSIYPPVQVKTDFPQYTETVLNGISQGMIRIHPPNNTYITMREEKINNLVKGIRDRAVTMWTEGNEPTPRWWLERIQELLIHVLPDESPNNETHG